MILSFTFFSCAIAVLPKQSAARHAVIILFISCVFIIYGAKIAILSELQVLSAQFLYVVN